MKIQQQQSQPQTNQQNQNNNPKYKCSKCQDTGKWYCGGLVIKDGNSYRCCDCLKYTNDQTSINFHHCMRQKNCTHCS